MLRLVLHQNGPYFDARIKARSAYYHIAKVMLEKAECECKGTTKK